MQVRIIIDVQNEFSPTGKRPVPDHDSILNVIARHVKEARREGTPIAWIRHFNKPNESPAFVPGSWGAELSPGFGPLAGFGIEKEFTKEVYGAFTGTAIEAWLKEQGAKEVMIAGFYTHGCVSTTAREAIMAGLDVVIDPKATGACDMTNEILGNQTAEEVRRSALLHLVNMGARLIG